LTTSRTDLATYREVISDEVYRLPRWLEAGINGRPIVDIGSCIGISPAYFASRYPNSPVVAIEASNRNYEYLQMNAEPYGGQIDPVHAAFASEPGQVGMTKLEPGLHNHVSYLFSNHTDSELHGETAPAITPKDILGLLNDTERIVVKVDIEGAEREIFSSPTIDPLLIRADLLLAETHNQYAPGSSQAVYEAAERNGLKPVQPGGHTEIYYRI
jgi:FkbM family methyltransferase